VRVKRPRPPIVVDVFFVVLVWAALIVGWYVAGAAEDSGLAQPASIYLWLAFPFLTLMGMSLVRHQVRVRLARRSEPPLRPDERQTTL
jgi:hypothetical protein